MAESTPLALLVRQVGRVRRRLFGQTLTEALVRCWAGALLLAVGWLLVEPFAVPGAAGGLRWTVAGGLVAAGTLLAVVLSALRAPSHVAAALALDERFQLRERATTALTLTEGERASPAGQALLADAAARVAPLRVPDRFPVRFPRRALLLPLMLLALFLLAWLYKPTVHSAPDEPPPDDAPLAKAQVEKALRQLQRKPAKKEGDRPKSEDMKRLEAELDALARRPPETKTQARDLVKDLTNAEDEVRKREKELAERTDALKEQMKQAERLSGKEKKDGPARKFDKALEQAAFQKAREEAERLGKQLQADEEVARLRKKMKDDKLTDEQKQELREQLDKLKDQELSREQKERLQEQLQDVQDKLRRLTRSEEAKERLQELHRQGALSKEELDRELEQLDQNLAKLDRETLEQLKELSQKLGECQKCMKEGKEGEAAKKLQEAAEQLARLDPNGEAKELQEQLQKLRQARQAVCQSMGGPGGPGAGRRPEAKDGPTGAKEEWSHSQLDKGRLQVIDHVPGDGFKGPRKPSEMTEDIRRAAQQEPEALDRQRLPRSASEMARGYFEKLRGPDRGGKKPQAP